MGMRFQQGIREGAVKRRMGWDNLSNYIFLIVYMLLSCSGTILMKIGGSFHMQLNKSTFAFQMSPISFLGFIFYFVSFLMWTKIITMFNLSYISPITAGISNVLLVLGGIAIFSEKVDIFQTIGIILVICGVVFINIKH